jgi:hypothetical protein
MRYTVGMTSDVMIYVPKFIKVHSGIQCSAGIINGSDLRMLYTIEITQKAYIPNYLTIDSGIPVILRVLPQEFERM